MATTVILARHAESEASAAGAVNGDPARPVGLTGRGREQAHLLAGQLAGQEIGLCVTTAFPRTQQTADLALAGRDIPRLVLAELNDPPFGPFEGQPIGEFHSWLARHGPSTPLGGESRAATVRRYARGMRTIGSRPEHTVLVIAHGLPVTYTLRAARGQDLPLTLGSAQVAYATACPLSGADVRRAAAVLEQWADEREQAA